MTQPEAEGLARPDLAALEAVDIRTVDPGELVDIRGVSIDPALPKRERAAAFLQQIKNPYCFKCGRMVVKVGFSEDCVSLEEQLKTIFSTMG